MSSINIGCDLTRKFGNGIGEIKFSTETLTLNRPLTANGIASDIVNEILENALDIATSSSHTDITWSENSCPLKKNFSTNSKFPEEPIKLEDNVGESLDQSQNYNIQQIVEGINNVMSNNNRASITEEPVRLDIEMKRLLSEMMSPPFEAVNYENIPRKDGVGDQPSTVEETISEDARDIMVDVDHTRMVEKKSRVTDLVMNSKQVLNEILMDEETRQRQEEWEESKEEVLQIIELECIKPEEATALINRKLKADSTTNLTDEIEEEVFITLPKDDIMDFVDLSSEAFEEEAKHLADKKESHRGGKGDDFKNILEHSMSPRSSKSLPTTVSQTEDDFGLKKNKKKKWNFGYRLWGFLKKRAMRHHHSSNENN